jgi:dihydroorotase
MQTHIIRNAKVVNEGTIITADVLIKNGRIEKVANRILAKGVYTETNAEGLYLIPGIIDDQVHFREPGLTHKASIYSESKAAVAGGVTSYMEMPNTQPAALTQALLAQKFAIGQATSLANYSFYMGTSNTNFDDLMQTNLDEVCGLKIFMGSSTGNLLVDDEQTLDKIFANWPGLIATHCESENIIIANTASWKKELAATATAAIHPVIRNEEACLASTNTAIALAKKHGTRLHVFHISTAQEALLFLNMHQESIKRAVPHSLSILDHLATKKITSEVCVHHLYFSANDYLKLGNLIKCNPAIKSAEHKQALLQALLADGLDLIATDHAPHTWAEKQQSYWDAPSGLPLVQHSLQLMLSFYHQQKISLEKIVEKMCHAPAVVFQLKDRGFIREGYYADLALVDIDQATTILNNSVFYKCKWTPLDNVELKGKVTHTFVNGHLVYHDGLFDECQNGMRLTFNRK